MSSGGDLRLSRDSEHFAGMHLLPRVPRVASLTHPAERLHPGEKPPRCSLTDCVPGVADGMRVERRAPSRHRFCVTEGTALEVYDNLGT